MASSNPLPDVPSINLTFPATPLILSALAYTKEHTTTNTVNHCVRSAYWALIIAKKHPAFAGNPLDTEAIVLSNIMHDMGWSTTKSLVSKDKRFEVDGADLARAYLSDHGGKPWDRHRLQLVWDAIALHTTPSIGNYKEPEVVVSGLGIMADFFGPNLPGGFITPDQYKAVAALFPRVGFREELKGIMCGLCREKPSTTFDNFVAEFGLAFGIDGEGTDKEKYREEWDRNRVMPMMDAAQDGLEQFE